MDKELLDKIKDLEDRIFKVETSLSMLKVSGRERPRRSVELTDIKCSDCGRGAKVPFKPRYSDRPIYCRECFQKHRGNRR